MDGDTVAIGACNVDFGQTGQDVVPKILHTILESQDTRTEQKTKQESVPRIRLQRDVDWQVSLDAMYQVNHGKSGTARLAFRSSKYKTGGKSGTSQVIGMKEDEEVRSNQN